MSNLKLTRCAAALCFTLLLGVAAHGGEKEPLWFDPGEVLNYRLYWGFIPVGASSISAFEVDTGGKKLIAIQYKVKTNRFFDRIYPVDDFIETLIDPDGFVPVTYTKKIKRRQPRCSETVVFLRDEGIANWYSECLATNGSFEIENDTRDIISLLYSLRRTPLAEGQAVSNRVVVTRGITDIIIKVGGRKKMDAGGLEDVECFKVVPAAKLDDLLVEEGEVEAWVSAGSRRIVTLLEIGAFFGSIRAELCGVQGPGDDEWVKASAVCKESEE